MEGSVPSILDQYSSGDLCMNDLKMCLIEFVNVEEAGISRGGLLDGNNSKCDLVMEDDCKVLAESSDDLPDSISPVESTSSATRSKLASAMKGSREKQGIPPVKLSVTWAPDVYDPIPTSVSHVPSSRNQYIRKYGKKKQKGGGKSSRGGKGKDKKQAQKNGTKLKPVHDDSATSFSEPEAGIIDFNVGSTDPLCGSSFLKESVQALHFPVAEATR